MASKPAPAQKDPRKQEAGRKGAAVRQQKLEALKEELTAAKKAVYSANTRQLNGEHTTASDKHTEEAATHSSTSQPSGSSKAAGWLVGIGIAAIAGAVLYSQQTTGSGRSIHRSHPNPPVNALAFTEDKKAETRSIFEME